MKNTISIEILELNNISYAIKRTNGKTYRLRFNEKGILIITFPYFSKESSLISFIEKNINWIKNKQIEVEDKKISYVNDSKHLVYGKEYILKINYSKTTRIDKIDNLILLSTSKPENAQKLLLKWRFEIAEMVFEQMLFKCFDTMKAHLKEFPKLEIKKSKTKWGCCYFNENRIMLNVALTQVPFELLEYVIYHELVHFIVKDHSKVFHQTLQQYVPNERKLAKELKKYTNKI